MEDKKITSAELLVLRKTARDAYFLCGQVENANRKFETAFVALEKAKEYRQEAIVIGGNPYGGLLHRPCGCFFQLPRGF